VLLLSQLFYPEMVSTGKVLTEAGVELTKRGWRIQVLCAPPAVI